MPVSLLPFFLSLSVLLSSHSTHHKREVKVQLLHPRPPQTTTSLQDRPAQSFQDAAVMAAAQTEARPSSGCLGDTRSAAAAAAAAVAATAPILKVVTVGTEKQ